MEDTLLVQTVGFGAFAPEGETETIDFANIVANDEVSDNETKSGIITAKYDIVGEDKKPDLSLAKKIQIKHSELLAKTGKLLPVEMTFKIGNVRKQGKKVLCIIGLK